MNRKHLLTLLALVTLATNLFAQDRAFVLYDSAGTQVSFERMVQKLSDADVLLFGELHDNPIAHWLQLETTKALHETDKLILGAEMFEADDQQHLNGYLDSTLDAKALDTLARLWPNSDTDYAPLVDFAKENSLAFIATNIPRRFARKVYKGGFEALDSLTAEEKEWVAPLPIAFDPELPTYKGILEMMGDHGTPDLVKAQASKDATMAHFILKNYSDGHLFIHYNGSYHSDRYEGILWYLKRERSDLHYATVSTVSQENINELKAEHRGVADFIICVDDDMTSTH